MEQVRRSFEGEFAILWYAREGFLFETLNQARRTQDTKTIIKLDFFLRDLHQEIQQRHYVTTGGLSPQKHLLIQEIDHWEKSLTHQVKRTAKQSGKRFVNSTNELIHRI